MNTRFATNERQTAQDVQAVEWLSKLLHTALELQASDIHLEPFDQVLRVRIRRDGVLYEMPSPAASLREQIISRIKVQSRLDIAEKRLPQDGRMQLSLHARTVPMADVSAHNRFKAVNSFERTSSVSSQQICVFTRQLATLIGAGVPLLQALDAIHQGMKSQALEPVVQQLRRQIAAGQSLQFALQQSGIFNNLYCQMVAAGELAGNLDEMLNRLAVHTERQQQLLRKVRMALVYPIAVLVIAALVVTVILIWVVPVFQSIFSSFGAQLPASTRFVLGLSAGLLHWGVPVVISAVLVFLVLRRQYRRSEIWQWQLALWSLKLPLIEGVVCSANLAAWTRCLSMLTQSGVPLLDALEVLSGVCNNRVYAQTCWHIRQSVLRGSSLAVALESKPVGVELKKGLFPILLVQMIDIGEQSGTLTSLLAKAADAQEESLEQQVQGLTQLIEPLLVVVLGGLVGGMVVALYLPVFQLGQIL